MAISYAKFKRTFGDLGITEWVKFNWLSNAGIARKIYNKVVEAGYNPLAYVNDELYNRITKSINVWDEEYVATGYILADGNVVTGYDNRFASKNFIKVFPNTEYYFRLSYSIPINGIRVAWYDANKTVISVKDYYPANNIITSPSNASFMKFNVHPTYGSSTYNNDICINLSNPYINGNYFPYFEGEKFLVLVGSVDLGTLNWVYNENRYFASVPNNLKPVPQGTQPNWKCDTYEPMPNNISLDTHQNGICYITGSSSFYTYAKSNTTPKPSGLLDYELARPVLIDL